MNDLKDFTYYVKKIWQNRRSRSAIILGLYVIFFVFVISGIRQTKNIKGSNGVDISNIDPAIENKMDNLYNFSKKKTYNIKGKLNDDNYSLTNTTDKVFRYDYKYYIVEGTDLYQYDMSTKDQGKLTNLDLDIKLWELTPKTIYDIVMVSDQIYEEKKTDGTLVTNYMAPLKKIYKYIPCNSLDVEKDVFKDESAEITINELNGEITYVEIDFTPFVRLMDPKTKSYIIKMNF